jgi:hypothetical protein
MPIALSVDVMVPIADPNDPTDPIDPRDPNQQFENSGVDRR